MESINCSFALPLSHTTFKNLQTTSAACSNAISSRFIKSNSSALLFIIIYVGAIAVLFLFVVMMLDVKVIESSKDLFKYLPIGSIVGLLFFIEITSVIYNSFLASPYLTKAAGIEYSNIYYNWYSKIDVLTDINSLGQILYTHYLLQFLIAGFILFKDIKKYPNQRIFYGDDYKVPIDNLTPIDQLLNDTIL